MTFSHVKIVAIIVHFSVAYVWLRGAKTTGRIAKIFGFSVLNLNFFGREISSIGTCFAEIKSFVV
jgi:hypothetical protein